MPKKKNSRKKHNPQVYKDRARRHEASRCLLYHWVETSPHKHGFYSWGPFPDDVHGHLMDWALNRRDTWIVDVVACFMTDSGEYYEEILTIPSYGPIVLADAVADFIPTLDNVIDEARNAGNPKHYVDVVVTLRLHTKRADSLNENDSWLKKQTQFRYETITKTLGKTPRRPKVA